MKIVINSICQLFKRWVIRWSRIVHWQIKPWFKKIDALVRTSAGALLAKNGLKAVQVHETSGWNYTHTSVPPVWPRTRLEVWAWTSDTPNAEGRNRFTPVLLSPCRCTASGSVKYRQTLVLSAMPKIVAY